MPSFVPHFVAPVLLALAFFPATRRRILAWSPFVWVADLDFLVQSVHRAATHTLLIPMALFAAVLALWRRRDPEARFWEFAWRPGAPANLVLATYYYTSQILMDVFAGGVVLFWPLWNVNFSLSFVLLLNTRTNTFQPHGDAGATPGPPEVNPLFPWISSVDTAMLAFLAAVLLTWLAVKGWQRWRGTEPAKPVVVEREAELQE